MSDPNRKFGAEAYAELVKTHAVLVETIAQLKSKQHDELAPAIEELEKLRCKMDVDLVKRKPDAENNFPTT
jgi:hypothetical protein